jgi:hypothetical protein
MHWAMLGSTCCPSVMAQKQRLHFISSDLGAI